jgi:hypothetical protein
VSLPKAAIAPALDIELMTMEAQIGASGEGLASPFNPAAPGVKNCVNCVSAFIQSVQSGEVVMAEGVSTNGGWIKKSNIQLIKETGILISDVPQVSTLNTSRQTQAFIVYRGTNPALSDHILMGFNNNGRTMLYDPQSGAAYWNLKDFGPFTAYAIRF